MPLPEPPKNSWPWGNHAQELYQAGRDVWKDMHTAPPRSFFSEKTPKEIEAWLIEEGFNGQEKARKAASIILYRHYHRSPSVNLFLAPSGSGKTFLWTLLQQADENIYIFDTSILTPQGYRGAKLESCFRSIPPLYQSQAIIVFDEFEKSLYKNDGVYRTSDQLQSEMLRCFNHDKVFFAGETSNQFFEYDFKNVTFVLLGAFSDLIRSKSRSETSAGFGGTPTHRLSYDDVTFTIDDIVKHTPLKEEVAGRIDRVVSMKPLTAQEIFTILLDYVENTGYDITKEIIIDHDILFRIAKEATTKEYGARWAESQVNQIIDNLLYENCKQRTLRYGKKDVIYD